MLKKTRFLDPGRVFLAVGFSLCLFSNTVWAQQQGYPNPTTPQPLASGENVQGVVLTPPSLLDLVSSRISEYSRTDLAHGLYFETLDGKPLLETNPDAAYNPASVTKIMTTLAVLERYSPNYRYTTRLSYTGSFDRERQTLVGDLVIESNYDPTLNYDSLFYIAEKLNEAGISTVEGNILVSSGLILNLRKSGVAAGNEILTTLDKARWTKASESAWKYYLQAKAAAKMKIDSTEFRGVTFVSGKVLTDDVSQPRKRLMEYHSAPILKVIKVMNAYSNNDMAHLLGRLVGGPSGVQDFMIRRVKLAPGEIRLESTSGLGSNAITPRGTVKLMRYAHNWCEKNRIAMTDLMPIGGVDNGTLADRFKRSDLVGSVVAKTGTLSNVSALAGVMFTKARGPVFFAILERGYPGSMRRLQEEIISLVAADSGGGLGIAYGSEMGMSLVEDARVYILREETSRN